MACCKSHPRYTTPAAYKASFFIEACVVKCWRKTWDTENLRCQANRLSHVMIDESYRKFYLINNILLKMWFSSVTVNKNNADIPRLLKIHFYWMSLQSLGNKTALSTAPFPNFKHKSIPNETYWHSGMSSLITHLPPFLQYSSGQTANIKVKIIISISPPLVIIFVIAWFSK